MGAINGAKYLGSNQVLLPADVFGYPKVVTIREAERRNFWSEAESKISRSGHPKGVKNFSGRAYNAKDIKRLFGGVNEALNRAIANTAYHGMQAIGREMLSRVVNNRGAFNNYTGNLLNAYQASIIFGRQIMTVVYNDAPKNKVMYTKNGKRYALLQKPLRHNVTRKKREREGHIGKRISNRRYIRTYELNDGYRQFGIKGGAFGYSQKGAGGGRVQSGIVIENTAPYADMVNRRYRVLNQASVGLGMNRWGRQYSKLFAVASKKELVAAGFKIK